MYSIESIKEKLILDIGEKRYKHSLRVAELSRDLAEKYDVDRDKAYLAGLIHDCAKYNEEAYITKLNIDISSYKISSIKDPVLHSFLGAEVAEKVYNVSDKDVLSAIKYHTTGKKDMTKLEKIIFIADAIEPDRYFDDINEIRQASKIDLDLAMMMLLDNNIVFLIGKKALINPLSFEARNYLIEERNGKARYNSKNTRW